MSDIRDDDFNEGWRTASSHAESYFKSEHAALAARVEALQRDLDRAVEVRENANTVSVRVEQENRVLAARVEELEARITWALATGCDDYECHEGCRNFPWREALIESRRILRGEKGTHA